MFGVGCLLPRVSVALWTERSSIQVELPLLPMVMSNFTGSFMPTFSTRCVCMLSSRISKVVKSKMYTTVAICLAFCALRPCPRGGRGRILRLSSDTFKCNAGGRNGPAQEVVGNRGPGHQHFPLKDQGKASVHAGGLDYLASERQDISFKYSINLLLYE